MKFSADRKQSMKKLFLMSKTSCHYVLYVFGYVEIIVVRTHALHNNWFKCLWFTNIKVIS